jgi:fructose-1-phosphate kinase PfkB-like protein
VQDFQCDAGGKGVNVAAFLSDYGLAVTATGFLGKDNPDLFESFFRQKKITDQFVRIAGSTRTGIKIIDEVHQETTDINFPGQAPSPADLQHLLTVIDQLSTQKSCARLATVFAMVAVTRIGAGLPPEISLESLESKVRLIEIKD